MARFASCNISLLHNTSTLNSSVSLLSGNQTCNATIQPINSTTSTAASYDFLPVRGTAKYICYVFYALVFFFGVVGNMIVFYVVGYRKKRRNGGDIYILSLACADFMSSVFVPMVMLNDLITDFSGWFYGEAMCYILPSMTPATMCASAWSLVLISLDRYRVILKPLAPRLHGGILFGSLAITWMMSVGVGLPYSLRLQLQNNICWDSNSKVLDSKTFLIFIGFWVLFIWCIPNFIIIIVYCLTALALKANTLKHANNRAMEQRNKQNARIVKMFIIIIFIFFTLTMPYAIFYFYGNYMIFYHFEKLDYRLITTLNYTLFVAASANGCVNPLIYAKMHREINGYLKSIFHRIRRFFHRRDLEAYTPSSSWSISTSKTDQSSM